MTSAVPRLGGASRPRVRTGPLVWGGLGLAALVAAVVAAVGFGGGGQGAGATGTLPPATSTVTRQTLVDTVSRSGELGYGTTRTIAAKAGGTVTWLPDSGAVLTRGQPLLKVDELPLVLLQGALPAYRTLAEGAVGADVAQLEDNLTALGYAGITVDQTFGPDTTAAVTAWQRDLGLPQTGQVDPGRIVYSDGDARVDAQRAAVGDTVSPNSPVLDLSGTARLVTATLDLSDTRLAVVGAAVSISLPDGKATSGKVASAATVLQAGTSGGGGGGGGQAAAQTTRLQVTIAADDAAALAGYDQASVDIRFTSSQRDGVLTVPVAALLALAEGGYGVQVVDGATTRTVAVTTGLFAGGRVEVSGDGIAEGTVVGMPPP